ncbi:MAG: alanine--glyoxylate aminotransferase family protein [Actinomycetota bacterium]|nr:alanine--glyoxylate aminotransferase family protein [Actinomycetota bacterium]
MKKDYIFTPGPTPVPLDVGMAQVNMVHHRSGDFGEILRRVLDGLKYVYRTKNDVFIFASSGTGAMEAAVANCFSPGDKVIVFSGGKFGERFVDISRFFGLDVLVSEYEWGTCANPEVLSRQLRANPDTKGVMLTHSETSTGVVNDVEAFGQIVAQTPALFIVDAISSLGAIEFETDAWNVDVAISGSQKGLMTPPGLSFVAVSDKAWKAVESSKLPRYYFCFKSAKKSQSKEIPETPYTPAITLIQAVDVALARIREEGLEKIYERHEVFGKATRAAVRALGLELFAKDNSRANICTSVVSPEGINSGELVKFMRNKFGVFISGGQAKLKGKIFRLAHVGYFDRFDIISQISALEFGLGNFGYEFEPGSGVSACMKVLMESEV